MTDYSLNQNVIPVVVVKDLSSAKIALITDGGLVPTGNPDQIESNNATRYGKYSIKGFDRLDPDDYEVAHLGYDTTAVSRDPNRLVPVDVLRDLEKDGAIGKLCESFYATTGFETTPENSTRMGQVIAKELKAEGVDGVIFLSSIWGTGARCGAAITSEIEQVGIPTVRVTAMTPVSLKVGSNEVMSGTSEVEKALRRVIVETALKVLGIRLAGRV